MYRKSPVSWSKHADFMFFDLLWLQIAFIIAFFLRQGSVWVYQDSIYREMALMVGLVHICVAVFGESYRDVLKRGWMVEFFETAKHVALVLGGEVFYLFFTKSSSEFSRLNTVYFSISAVLLLYGWRCFWKRILIKNMLRIKDKRLFLLVADQKNAEKMLSVFQKQKMLDFEIRGVILYENVSKIRRICGVPVVGDLSNAERYLENNVVDEVLFAQSRDSEPPQELMKKCEVMGLTIHIQIPENDILPSAATIEHISGIPVFSSCVRFVTARQMMIKRCMDIVGGIVGLIFTGIISIFVVPAILICDPGPVIFSQTRVGKNGRLFKLYKFRSMYRDAEDRKKEFEAQNQINGPMFKMEADPRIIGSGPDGRKKGLGWFLRSSSLDEFPQFWNVLKGDMSLVGTRPPTVDEWEKYELHHRSRMAIKP